MSNPDSEGYTLDSPVGLYVLFEKWEDYPSSWKEDVLTFFIEQKYKMDHTNDPNYTDDEDPMFRGLHVLFQRMLQIKYKNQVTGSNLDAISGDVRLGIINKIKSTPGLDAITSDPGQLSGFWLFLNTVGDYSAQLASRLPPGGFQTDANGDILRLRYVTRGNYLKFGLSLNLAGQLLDPVLFGVFSEGGPSFTVYFDTVTSVDLQLPHRSSDGFQIVQAMTQNAGADVHSENADGDLVLSSVQGPIARAVNESQRDFSNTVSGQLQSFNRLLSQAKFDEADYSLDGDQVQMKFTQHPLRDFELTIDYVQDLFPGQVQNQIKAQIGVPGTPVELVFGLFVGVEGYIPLRSHYADGTRYVLAEIQILRQFTHMVVAGHLVNLGGHFYVMYDDGTREDLGFNFDPSDPGSAELLKGLLPKHIPHPPGTAGLVRTIYLYLDYALQTITGRYPDSSVFKVKAGQQIRVPGNSIVPEIWFTLTMDGTRNGEVPKDAEPPNPPRPTQTAVYVGG